MASTDMSHLIIGWVTDYCASSLLSSDEPIDNANGAGTKRMISMCVEMPEASLPSCYRLQHRIICLFHALEANYGLSEWVDPVALAFNKVIQMLDHSPDTQDYIRTAAEAIKKEAVFALCRQNMFDQAEEVFTRVWGKCSSPLEKKTRETVMSVMNSKDSHHETLQTPDPFTEMVASMQCILGHIRNKLKEPFLVQAAAQMKRTGQVEDEEEEARTNTGLILTSRLLKQVRTRYGLRKKKNTAGIRKEAIAQFEEIHRNKAAYITSMPDILKYGPNCISLKDMMDANADIDTSSAESERSGLAYTSPKVSSLSSTQRKRVESLTSTTLRKRAPSLTFTPPKRAPSLTSTQLKRARPKPQTDTAMWVMTDGNCRDAGMSTRRNLPNEEEEERDSSTSTISEDIFAKPAPWTLGSKMRIRKSLAPSINSSVATSTESTRRRRAKWLHPEEMSLYQGVKEFGMGQWAMIKKKYNFVGRTNIDLKDKWRNLVRSGRVDEWNNIYEKQRNLPDEEEGDSSTSTISEDIFAKPVPWTLSSQMRIRKSLAPSINSSVATSTESTRCRRAKWLHSEEMSLYQGVKEFGMGQWAMIKKKYNFVGRTNIDLKDKWRNLVRSGRVDEWNDIYEEQ